MNKWIDYTIHVVAILFVALSLATIIGLLETQ